MTYAQSNCHRERHKNPNPSEKDKHISQSFVQEPNSNPLYKPAVNTWQEKLRNKHNTQRSSSDKNYAKKKIPRFLQQFHIISRDAFSAPDKFFA